MYTSTPKLSPSEEELKIKKWNSAIKKMESIKKNEEDRLVQEKKKIYDFLDSDSGKIALKLLAINKDYVFLIKRTDKQGHRYGFYLTSDGYIRTTDTTKTEQISAEILVSAFDTENPDYCFMMNENNFSVYDIMPIIFKKLDKIADKAMKVELPV